MDTLVPHRKTDLFLPQSHQGVHNGLLADLSVIVPVGPYETAWPGLLRCLNSLPVQAEILLVGTSAGPAEFEQIVYSSAIKCNVRWIVSSLGRARQMNAGAAASSSTYLWFLHADTDLSPSALEALVQSLESAPEALHYFQLRFKSDGPRTMVLNTLGVYFRSRVLGLPFGDQGFCLKRKTFIHLGGFNEQAAYGEDHLLVWAAHRQRVPLCEVNAAIVTSSRRYRESGWLLSTLLNLGRTWYQALPRWIELLWSRRR